MIQVKNNDDLRMLEHKRRIDAERRERAITRERQARLRDLTPGTATPASVMARVFKQQQAGVQA